MGEEQTEHIETKPKEEKKKKSLFSRLMRIFLKISLITIAVLFILSISFIGLSQTEGFRHWLSSYLLEFVNDELEGKLEFTDIILNPFKGGLEVKNVCLTASGDTVVFCKDVVVNFKIRPLLFERARVNYIYLESPNIKLIRSKKDSSWNFEHIAKPSKDTTTSKTNWLIEVKKLIINNASIRVYDKTQTHESTANVDYGNLNLENFNLKLSCLIKLREPSFAAKIESMKFRDKNSGIVVKNMFLDAVADTSKLEVKVLNLYTGSNSISLSAMYDKINIFSDKTKPDFNNSPLTLKLKADPVDMDEVMKFIPIPVKFAEKYVLDLDADGSLNSLNIKKLNLAFNNSELKLTGKLKYLTESDKFDYLVRINKTSVDYNDLMKRLPFLEPETIPDFGSLTLNNTEAHGRTDSIFLKLDANCGFGKFEGQAGVGFRNKLTYSTNLKTENFNLSNILHNPDFTSSLNSTIKLSGAGTDLKNMNLWLNISSYKSKLLNYYYNDMNLTTRIDGKGTIFVDTLNFVLNNRFTVDSLTQDFQDKAKISLSGKLNLSDFKKPVYNFNLFINGLNTASLTKNPYAPEYLSGEISINGEGFDLDSLNTELNAKITDCAFTDRALNPFTLNIIANHNGSARALFVKSDFLNITLAGNFNYKNLFTVGAVQGLTIADFVMSKVNIMTNSDKREPTGIIIPKLKVFEPMNLSFHSDIKDLSLLAVFLKDMKLHSISTFDLSWECKNNTSRLSIDSIHILDFEIDAPTYEISSRPVLFMGNIDINLNDSIPSITNFLFNFNASGNILINDIKFFKPYASVNYSNNLTDFTVSSGINDILNVYNHGKINFAEHGFEVAIDSTRYAYHDSVAWTSPEKIDVMLDSKGIDIKNFKLKRNNKETIMLSGQYSNDGSHLNLFIKDFNLPDIAVFLPKERQKSVSAINGNVDSLVIDMKGNLNNPEININLKASGINYNGTQIGNLNGKFRHLDSLVTGILDITNNQNLSAKKTLSVDIQSLPLNLGIGEVENRIHKANEFNIIVKSYDLPLELASPFVPVLENLRGKADASLKVSGYAPDDISVTGDIQYRNASFTVLPTNMRYNSKGSISLETDKILFKNLEIFNFSDDMPKGKAVVNGVIDFKNFEVGYMDFEIKSPGLKVLSNASVRPMPGLYGDFIISTGPAPVRFFGTLDAPYLQGDVNILYANLMMPATSGSQLKRSAFRYEEKNHYIIITAIQDSIEKSNKNPDSKRTRQDVENKDFADLLDYDMNIRIKGSFLVNMEMGFQQSLLAEIGVRDPSQPLRFVLRRGSNEPNFYGDILVNDGSTLTFFKQFNTYGSITFPTGTITNPGLDLVAEYKGVSTIGTESRDYTVILYVTGTKEKPNIRFSYKINNREVVGDTSKIREDAIFMLILGKTKDELSRVGAATKDFIDIGSTQSAVASSFLTDVLQGTGIIQSADIDFSKGSWEQATVKLTGQFIGTKWKVGGNVGDMANNYEFSIEYPLPLFLSPVLQLTRSFNTTNPTTRNQKEYEFKIKIGNSW